MARVNVCFAFITSLMVSFTAAPGSAWETTDVPCYEGCGQTAEVKPWDLMPGMTLTPGYDPTVQTIPPPQVELRPMIESGPINVPLPEPPAEPKPCAKKKGVLEKVGDRCEKWTEDHPVAWRRAKNVAAGFLFLVNLTGAVGNTVRW